MTVITVMIKTLNGELMEIQHDPLLGFDRFMDKVYEEFPDIPLGCLVLRRAVSDDYPRSMFHRVLEELHDLFERMSKPMLDDLPYKERVTRVLDGDYFYAVADLSLVRPVVFADSKTMMICDDYTKLTLRPYFIEFYSTVEYDPMDDCGKHLYSGPGVFFDKKHHLFALQDTFEEAESYEGISFYCPTGRTKWFLSVIECLESMPNVRFPQNEETLISIRKQIDEMC